MMRIQSLLRTLVILVSLMLVSAAALSTRAHAQAGFVAEIVRPQRNPAQYGYLADWFEQSQYLHQLASGLSAGFSVPRQVAIGVAECGTTNAFYDPNHRAILLCYELVDDIVSEFRYDGLTDDQRNQAIIGALSFVFFHELGHALIDQYDLPITGREEDVADQVATYILAESNPISAYWAAQYWIQKDDPGDTGLFKGLFRTSLAFADEHALDEQRFFNVLCWTYGGDPQGRAYLLELIPAARAQRCPGEYRRMSGALETLLAPHTRRASSAHASSGGTGVIRRAGEGSGSTTGVIRRAGEGTQSSSGVIRPRTATLAGDWSFAESLASGDRAISCENHGTLRFSGSGAELGGSYSQQGTCRIGGTEVDNPGSGTLTAQVAGGVLSFRQETCLYTAQVRDGNSRLEGTVSCEVEGERGTIQVNGTWVASRLP
jgi:Putative metallopeptidase